MRLILGSVSPHRVRIVPTVSTYSKTTSVSVPRERMGNSVRRLRIVVLGILVCMVRGRAIEI